MAAKEAKDLEDLLDELEDVIRNADSKVSVREVYSAIGERSFGPLLLAAGLLGMTPISAIPGAPSALALITILIAIQLVAGRRHLWLPQRLLRLSVGTDKFGKTVRIARKPARMVDRVVRPRLCFLTRGVGNRLAALVCALVAAAIPPLELLPLVAIVPATAIFAFGLGLVTRDGVVLLIAFAASLGTAWLIIRQLLG